MWCYVMMQWKPIYRRVVLHVMMQCLFIGTWCERNYHMLPIYVCGCYLENVTSSDLASIHISMCRFHLIRCGHHGVTGLAPPRLAAKGNLQLLQGH